MMLITDALLGEHAVFYLLFQDIEQALPAIDSVAALQHRVAPLAFSLEAHARLEDELLFTALEPVLGTQGGPLAVMRIEHDQIVNLLERTLAATELDRGRVFAAQTIEVSRDHFHKEELVLFNLARQFLGEQALLALGAQWSGRRLPWSASDVP